MSEMIEKIVLAVWEQRKKCAEVCGIDLAGFEKEELFNTIKSEIVDEVKVMLQTLREPTEEMKTCSEEVHWDYSCQVCGGLKEGWYKMIDAALK